MSSTLTLNLKDIYRKNVEDVKDYLKKRKHNQNMDMLPLNG
jgi:hypothetical protein